MSKLSRFDGISFDEEAKKAHQNFKVLFERIEFELESLERTRSSSMVLTKLEDAFSWVGKAVRDDQCIRGRN